MDYQQDNKWFTEAIAKLRALGVIRYDKEVADALECAPVNFSAMKRGRRDATLGMIATLCEKYGYSADYIIAGRGGKRGVDATTTAILKELREIRKAIK